MDKDILKDNGKIKMELAKMHAETEFEKYRIIRNELYHSDFDLLMEETEKYEVNN